MGGNRDSTEVQIAGCSLVGGQELLKALEMSVRRDKKRRNKVTMGLKGNKKLAVGCFLVL